MVRARFLAQGVIKMMEIQVIQIMMVSMMRRINKSKSKLQRNMVFLEPKRNMEIALACR
jgi:hypothetical protein